MDGNYLGERELTSDERKTLGAMPYIVKDEDLPNEEQIARHVPGEEELISDSLMRVTYLWHDQHLFLHVWRGEGIPDSVWGDGRFYICLREAVTHVFPMDKPTFEYVGEVDSYFCVIPNAGLKPRRPDTERIRQIPDAMRGYLTAILAG